MLARLILLFSVLVSVPLPASAQDREVPYWATIRASELNMRVGPSVDYRIAWVYRRPGLPVKVVRVMEGWRFIKDPAGDEGWVVARLLSPDRGAIVTGEGAAALRYEPDESASIKWRVEPGVVGALGDCSQGWCELHVGDRSGWIPQSRLWGAGEP